MSVWTTPLGIAGIVMIILGLILAIVGIVLLVLNKDITKPWYIWVMLGGGIVIGIIGGILLAVAYAKEKPIIECVDEPRYIIEPQQVMVRTPQPQYVTQYQPQPKQIIQAPSQQQIIQTPPQQIITAPQPYQAQPQYMVQNSPIKPSPQPLYQAQQGIMPASNVSYEVDRIDDSTFDPYPITNSVVEKPAPRVETRMVQQPDGTIIQMQGVFQDDTQIINKTIDYGQIKAN